MIIGGLLAIAGLIYLFLISKRSSHEGLKVDVQPLSEPQPLVSYGSCCTKKGCTEHTGVNLDLAKEECEKKGGVFKAFTLCSEAGCDSSEESPKKNDNGPKKAAKKAPKSSLKVSRKNTKKKQRKNRDY